MPTITRRAFAGMFCCSGAAVLPCLAHARSLSSSSKGCQLSNVDLKRFQGRNLALGSRVGDLTAKDIRRTTRSPEMDRALDQALKRIADTFGVFPGFGFYDDSDGENAWATPAVLLERTDGTVLFGERLFATLMKFDPAGGAVTWTAAHEFAHIRLYKSGQHDHMMAGQGTVKRLELHADFLAGFYLGSRKRVEPNVSLYNAGHDIWNSGDTLYNDPAHHGAPAERVAAAEAGFKMSFIDRQDGKHAFDAATRYVMRF